jgi:hypothetical protein
MKQPRVLTIVFFLTIILFSCDKDEKEVTDRSQLLTSRTWKTTAATIDPALDFNGDEITDLYNDFYDNCVNDNTYSFTTNGIIVIDEAGSKCEATDPQTNSGTWSFNGDKTVLTISVGTSTTAYRIIDFNKNAFKVSFTERVGTTSYTITETYSAK